ncbi:hypothetical protein TIFTF001_041220 [Ficus carica]|uniref:RNase H type-1 domain-containing protein n=1 Tax=Ficus carica TaxID=3494 RepID=A0AA87Z3H6_FICCA|nr:hypothetical protein TIFTF001_041220 [Ficus carica]
MRSLWQTRNIAVHNAKWWSHLDVLDSVGRLLGDYPLSFEFVGIGAVIRDAAGTVISCLSKRVAGLFSPHVAECIALREGLEMAMACGVALIVWKRMQLTLLKLLMPRALVMR